MEIGMTLLGQALSFAILIWFTAKYIWPPLMAAIEERQQKIAEGLAAADRSQKDLAQAQDKVNEALKDARGKANEIIEQAHQRANQLIDAAKNDAISRILAMALACDQTRVFFHALSTPVSNVLFPGATAGHHNLTHDEPGDQPEVHAITLQIMEAFAQTVQILKDVPEGDGTLLDHCILLGLSEISLGKLHLLEESPILLAGGGCGALKKGIHYRSLGGENTSKVHLSILHAMGVRAASFGNEDGRATDGLGAIEA